MHAVRPARHSSLFEQQRSELLQEIGVDFERVLANINKLNRTLEGVIAIGHEFSSVEALWSTFENVMSKDTDESEVDTQQANNKDGRAVDETTSMGTQKKE
ncbi:hypothetical protein K3495_g5692 [Podosphaera aphanis]|nr:hypothetical protein K3495_g5692 [Podosphaera aphanis]